ncbi:MAG: hypothetical protein BJ554DRAFT_7718 [Olpidium bornovanus]|uniref:Uncharacterized protein n=1 Tax=Olpidium bornovanus TaxID=278681 RepID=A0A8H8DJ24_9FUNG|nr:MAG: hypothetical protein BJ554DRAFT_7718 [Olpidium bornovanus]
MFEFEKCVCHACRRVDGTKETPRPLIPTSSPPSPSPGGRIPSDFLDKGSRPRRSPANSGSDHATGFESTSGLPQRRTSVTTGSIVTQNAIGDVEAEFPVRVHVRVKHLRNKPHGWRLRGICLVELEHELKRAVLERRFDCGRGNAR